jgi:stearoyl-CoA desaturase (delta-9 desaturase)
MSMTGRTAMDGTADSTGGHDRGHHDGPRPINWPTTAFILATSLVTLLWPVYAYFYGFTTTEVVLAVVYFVMSGMAITVGYHRLIAHRSFKCRGWVKAGFLVAASSAWQGSALEWAADHVRHHAYVDTDRDPYSITKGFWYAHVGWLIHREERCVKPPAFLTEDRWVVLQDRFYVPLAFVTTFVIPFLIADIGGVLLAGIVRLVACHHATWLINSWAHVGSHRPYSTEVSANDNWFLSLFTFGEGFHNYHHTFPQDYRNGVALLAWDPSKWLIWTLASCGLAHDLKRVGSVRRWRQRVETLLDQRGAGAPPAPSRLARTRAALERRIARNRAALERLVTRTRELEAPSTWTLAELRERLNRSAGDVRQTMTAASAKRVERVRELVEATLAYQALAAALSDCEPALAQGSH